MARPIPPGVIESAMIRATQSLEWLATVDPVLIMSCDRPIKEALDKAILAAGYVLAPPNDEED
jgi:hypothetical protein